MEKIKVLIEQLAKKFSYIAIAEQWSIDDCQKGKITYFLRYLPALNDVEILDRAGYIHTFFLPRLYAIATATRTASAWRRFAWNGVIYHEYGSAGTFEHI